MRLTGQREISSSWDWYLHGLTHIPRSRRLDKHQLLIVPTPQQFRHNCGPRHASCERPRRLCRANEPCAERGFCNFAMKISFLPRNWLLKSSYSLCVNVCV